MAAGDAIVHLPRSLVALFPGAPRRLEVAGATVAEVIDALDRQVPGMRNRLLDAGPSIRAHINIYVSAERAALETDVPPGADVHIIPAVSGGSGQIPRSPGPLTHRDALQRGALGQDRGRPLPVPRRGSSFGKSFPGRPGARHPVRDITAYRSAPLAVVSTRRRPH